MKINSLVLLSLISLVFGRVVHRENKFRPYDDDDNNPIDEKSRVTAFVNTDDGLKVECWEIEDLLPQNHFTRAYGSKGAMRERRMAGKINIALYTFSPSTDIFSLSATRVHSNAVDFRAKPNLFTVKDGLIFIEALPASDSDVAARDDDDNDDYSSQHVFADVNGDDWFYFEDQSGGNDEDVMQCGKATVQSQFNVRTISGSDTTLINFEYDSTPKHKVLHEGRCNFAGLRPVSPSSQNDPDYGKPCFRLQDL